MHGVLSKALNHAVLNEMIRSNPAQLPTLPRKELKEIATLSAKQIQLFSVLVEQDSYRAILKFILFSGVRESEAIGLTWDCIDFDRGTIRIHHQLLQRPKSAGGYTLAPLKNDSARLLTPPPALLALLKERKHEQMQQRITGFVAAHSGMPEKRYTQLMLHTGELVMDMGTVLDGRRAVKEKLIDELGGLSDALDWLHRAIETRE